jgi:UDP-N-acetyl-D-mannosaminuronic acid dehydrogenase
LTEKNNLLMQKICVVGLGYIGLPTAAMFATHGFQVVGMDINDRVVEVLKNGQVHIHEPGLKTLVTAAIKSGNLHITNRPEPADAFIITVPTPLIVNPNRDLPGGDARISIADLSFVKDAAEQILPYLQPGNLVVLESTVPPRTTIDMLIPILERSSLKVGEVSLIHGEKADGSDKDIQERSESFQRGADDNQLYVAHCPERVLPGRILEELVGNDRIIGGYCRNSAQLAKELYASFVEGEIFITDATTAEMVKLMENTYRDVNIALANELALVAEQVGTNVWESIALANRHPRVQILAPGPGVGGHCIAVDPWFIAQIATDVTPLIRTARQVNDSMPQHVVELVKEVIAELPFTRAGSEENQAKVIIACLGLAYKSNVDDTRQSPAIEVVELLRGAGFEMRAYDGHVPMGTVPEQVDSLAAAVDGADVIVLLTDHSEFRELTPTSLPGYDGQIVIDTRNSLPIEEWVAAGARIFRLGDSQSREKFDPPIR